MAIGEVQAHGTAGRPAGIRTPAGVVRELYAPSIGHFAVRAGAAEAAAAAGVKEFRACTAVTR